MDQNISYDNLWQACQKEKQTNQLLLLSKTFYEDVTDFIKSANIETTNPILKENTIKLLNEFFERRKQKILIYVAYNKQLPQPITNNELEFYNKVLQTVKSEKLNLSEKNKSSTHLLKSMKDIPEIILPSGNKLGPLKKDQTIEPKGETDDNYLIENAICEKIY